MEDATTSTMAPAASPTSALSPEDAEAAEEILAAFDSYMEGLIELSTEGVPGGTEETEARLEEIPVSGEALLELAYDLLTPNAQAGYATDGTLRWEAAVVDIDWEHTFRNTPEDIVPLATLRVCVDETNWMTVETSTGEIVSGPGERYLSEVTVTWRDEDPQRPEREPRWQVSFREDTGEPC